MMATSLQPGMAAHDKDMAARFLAALDPTGKKFTFQFFSDGDGGYAEIAHCSLDDVWPKVQARNTPQRGIGVFVTINETDLRGRRADNIVRPRALFVDADGPEQVQRCRDAIRSSGAEPSMVVGTSAERAHFYFCCDDLALDQFSPLQADLIQKLGADRAVKDLARVMRLPGTLHLKDVNTPRKVTLLIPGQARRWTVRELVGLLGLSPEPERHKTKPNSSPLPPVDADRLGRLFGPRYLADAGDLGAGLKINVDEIRSAVAAIPPSAIATEPEWMKLARGVAHQARLYTDQAEELCQVVDEASRLAAGYDEAENRRRFDRYTDEALDRDDPITIATVFDMARKHGWKGWAPATSPLEPNCSVTVEGNPSSGFGPGFALKSGLNVSFSGIPHRRWLYGVDLVRGEITLLAAPGGVGKSSLAVAMSLAVATGKPLLDERICGDKLTALYINAEDSCVEMGRRVWADCLQHRLTEQDLDRFFLLGADDWRTQKISFLRTEKGASLLDAEGMGFLESLLGDLRPDVVVFDPLVALCGGGNLNDNSVMSLVLRALKRMANKFDCAVLILHHIRKGGDLGSAEAIGGASAIVNLARRALMAVPMGREEAIKLGVLPSECLGYFKVIASKSNLAPPSDQVPWYKLCSVTLPNPEPPVYMSGDRVQAVVRVQLSSINTGSAGDDLKIRRAVLDVVARGKTIDGERVQYSPNLSGAKNGRGLLDDAMAAAAAATAPRQWQPGDLEAVVKRAIEAMKTAGTLVGKPIRTGRFRRLQGLEVDWSRTPWPNAGVEGGGIANASTATDLQGGGAESGGQLVNGAVND